MEEYEELRREAVACGQKIPEIHTIIEEPEIRLPVSLRDRKYVRILVIGTGESMEEAIHSLNTNLRQNLARFRSLTLHTRSFSGKKTVGGRVADVLGDLSARVSEMESEERRFLAPVVMQGLILILAELRKRHKNYARNGVKLSSVGSGYTKHSDTLNAVEAVEGFLCAFTFRKTTEKTILPGGGETGKQHKRIVLVWSMATLISFVVRALIHLELDPELCRRISLLIYYGFDIKESSSELAKKYKKA